MGRDHITLFSPLPPIYKEGIKMLEKQGVEIVITDLELGDHIVNKKIAFKRITIKDLLKSIFEEIKLFDQIKHLAARYDHTILIIEGEDPFFSGRTVNPGSIQGFLRKLAVSFQVPVVFTLNEAETSEIISSIAGVEQPEQIGH
ncbi:MAG: hypothetical protein C3F06_14305 [Candidatus Methanoperedenaceae archaeon]|nr:MAG: hypothetical protein C3F06_14305 [Candidatus Methanoperedenaceae archaeon]